MAGRRDSPLTHEEQQELTVPTAGRGALRREQMIRAWNEGLSMAEIGRRFGCSRQRVHQIVNGGKGKEA